MCYLTDGRIKDTDLPLLLPDSATLADELVTKGLWRRTRGGYVFKDWLEWGGKKTAREIRELRAQRAAAGRKGGVASGNTRRSKQSKPQGGASGLLEPHTQPSPAIKPPAGFSYFEPSVSPNGSDVQKGSHLYKTDAKDESP